MCHHSLISSYLMETGVIYKDVRRVSGSKQRTQGLYPEVRDVVLFKDSKDHVLFGLVLEALESNNVKVRVISRGKTNEEVDHTYLLKFTYRPLIKVYHQNFE